MVCSCEWYAVTIGLSRSPCRNATGTNADCPAEAAQVTQRVSVVSQSRHHGRVPRRPVLSGTAYASRACSLLSIGLFKRIRARMCLCSCRGRPQVHALSVHGERARVLSHYQKNGKHVSHCVDRHVMASTDWRHFAELTFLGYRR